MASPPPPLPSSSDDSSPGTQKSLVANKFLSHALLLSSSSSSSIPLLVFNHQPSIPKSNVHDQVTAGERFFRNLHKTVVSATDGCLGFLHSFASNPPFLNTLHSLLHSLPSPFRNFSQVERLPHPPHPPVSPYVYAYTNTRIHQKNYRNLNGLSKHNFAAILPGGDSVAGLVVANGINNFLNIYSNLLVVRLVLTWFPNSPPAIVSPLSTLCDPYLNIFRGIIPPLGGTLDLSPILAFLVLNAFTSAASALPAELPSTDTSSPSNPSTSHQKRTRKSNGSRRKSSGGGH